mgnify:CR=1 FL=1
MTFFSKNGKWIGNDISLILEGVDQNQDKWYHIEQEKECHKCKDQNIYYFSKKNLLDNFRKKLIQRDK